MAREYRKDLKLAMTPQPHAMARMKKFVSVRLEFVLNGANGPNTGPVTQFVEGVLPPGHASAWVLVSVTVQSNLRNLVIITSVLVGLIGLRGHHVPSHAEVKAFKKGHVLALASDHVTELNMSHKNVNLENVPVGPNMDRGLSVLLNAEAVK